MQRMRMLGLSSLCPLSTRTGFASFAGLDSFTGIRYDWSKNQSPGLVALPDGIACSSWERRDGSLLLQHIVEWHAGCPAACSSFRISLQYHWLRRVLPLSVLFPAVHPGRHDMA